MLIHSSHDPNTAPCRLTAALAQSIAEAMDCEAFWCDECNIWVAIPEDSDHEIDIEKAWLIIRSLPA